MNIQQHDIKRQRGNSKQNKISRKGQSLNKSDRYKYPEVSLELIVRKLIAGFQKLFIALKYHFHQLTAGAFLQIKFPWFKVGLAAIVFLIITQKDIQFSVNMKAPLSGAFSTSGSNQEHLGLVQPVVNKAVQAPPLPAVNELDEQQILAYIKRFSKVASTEREKFGIPASVKMAQGILESWAGGHPEAKQSNNHFGVPTSGMHYNSAWENWRAHSLLLREHYSMLFHLGTDAHEWAKGLQANGYSQHQDYADRLMSIINKYGLLKLDEV